MPIDFDTTTRDSVIKSVVLGVSLPLLILALVIYNVIALRVIWFERHEAYFYTAQEHLLIFLGTVIFKVSVAGGFFSWFYMGNDRNRLDAYYQQSLLGCLIGLGVGLLLVFVGAFVHL